MSNGDILYHSPPGSGGNDGALPTVYDPAWMRFTNLTPAQIVAFQGFPQDLLLYASTRRWLAEISGTTVSGIPLNTQDRDQAKVSQLKQAFDAGVIAGGTVSFSDATGNIQTVNAATATALYAAIVAFVQSTYTTYANLFAGINAKTITTRKQIDAAYAAIAPNSPSTTNPSPT